MQVIQGLDSVDPPIRGSVLTIGNFDGVHRAHQQLLAQADLFAANTGGPVVALTFEPHPLTIVSPAKAPPRLMTIDDKLQHLAKAGANIAVVAKSEPALLGLEAESFVTDVILRRFTPTHIVEGPSFGFGRGRTGTPELLSRMAADSHCEVHIVEPVTLQIDDGDTLLISSSLIRRLITEGKVHRAAVCLGRPYRVSGRVVEGDRRGRSIGFPTINLSEIMTLVPGDGVYAGYAEIDDRSYTAAISVGANLTFGGDRRRVEAHLPGFEGDVYGAAVRLSFERRLRDHIAFDSTDALVEQLHRDVAQVVGGAGDADISGKVATP